MKDYKGCKLERVQGTQVSHPLPNSRSLRQRLGHGTHRKIWMVQVTFPDGYVKNCDNRKHAIEYIDSYYSCSPEVM